MAKTCRKFVLPQFLDAHFRGVHHAKPSYHLIILQAVEAYVMAYHFEHARLPMCVSNHASKIRRYPADPSISCNEKCESKLLIRLFLCGFTLTSIDFFLFSVDPHDGALF